MDFWDEIRPARKHQWTGAMADVRAARYDGLAAYSPIQMAAGAGALAGVGLALVIMLLPISIVRPRNLLLSVVIFGLYGLILGIWRRRDALSGRTLRLFAWHLAPHSFFNYLALPFAPCILVALWQPKEGGSPDNFFGALITLLGLFWIGAAFDYVWEALDNLALGRLTGLRSDITAEYTLRKWIPREEAGNQALVECVECRAGKVAVTGQFARPAELRRKLQLLDFVKEAQVVAADTKPAAGQGE